MSTKAVEIEIRAKIAEAIKQFKQFSQDASKGLKDVKDQAKATAQGLKDTSDATGGLSKTFSELKNAAMGIAAALGVYKGFSEIAAFLKSSSEEAAGAELSIKSLDTSLIAAGRDTGDFKQQMHGLAEALQKETGFSHEAVESAIKLLSPFENITNDLFPRTIQATIDLARALQIDLPTAAEIVGRASLGVGRGLRGIGISFTEAEFKAIGFAGVLSMIETKVKGQAETYRETSKGLSDFIKTMWGEVKEQFGIIVNQVLDPFKKSAGEVLTILTDKLGTWVKTVDLKTWAAGAAENFKAMATVYIPALIKSLDELIPKIEVGLKTAGDTFTAFKIKFKEVLDTLKLGIDGLKIFWDMATGRGFTPKALEDWRKAYDDTVRVIKDLSTKTVADIKKTADEVKDEPIIPAVDNTVAKGNLDDLHKWWADYKAKMESEPIKVRIIRETITAGEGTTTEWGKERWGGLIKKQSGGLVPGGFGGGDQVPVLAEPGEFMMRKEAVRSLGVDMLSALNRGAGGGSKGYMVVDFRLAGKSFPLTVQKEGNLLDNFVAELRKAELTRG